MSTPIMILPKELYKYIHETENNLDYNYFSW